MKFEAMMGKKKVIVSLISYTGDQALGYTGKFNVTGKTKGEFVETFDHYIPPVTGRLSVYDLFFDKVSKLPKFKTSIRQE